MSGHCPFCQPVALFENELACALEDRYPVTPGHLLVVPKRHSANWFELTDRERQAINELLLLAHDWLIERYQPAGFNIGMNCGVAAGQTVFHTHCHLIPRYEGDCDDPRGGVRAVIPDKQRYE